jgi:GTPase SAR1 family protein
MKPFGACMRLRVFVHYFHNATFCLKFSSFTDSCSESGYWTIDSVLALLPSVMKMPYLYEFNVNVEPRELVGSKGWRAAGLPVLPDEIILQLQEITGGIGEGFSPGDEQYNNWPPLLQFLRAGSYVAVHELRLMLIGDGEAGKTSLQRAFVAPGHKAEWIGKRERTVGIIMDELRFESEDKPNVKCQVCDFAGQEIYYLSHTLHFTRRCLYVLMWTTHKFSESGAAQELTLEDIMSPMKQWLQLLATNVPEANLLLVGTHCLVEPNKFEAMRALVERQVLDEMQRLRTVADAEIAATRKILKRQQTSAHHLATQINVELGCSPQLHLATVDSFVKGLSEARPVKSRGLMQKAKLLLQTVQELTRTQARLCRLHGVHDGSVPQETAPPAHLRLVMERSFAVDSIEGFGVAELLASIEATCRDTQALPFMGEHVPQSWLQVSDAMHQAQGGIGNCVMSLEDAVNKMLALLQRRDVEASLARHLDFENVKSSLVFWSLLGRVFIHDGHFLRDPRLLIDLLKPLVHYDVLDQSMHKDGFRLQCLANPSDFSSDNLLKQLQKDAVLDHRLLSHLAAWRPLSSEARASILKFFEGTFMISALHASNSLESGGSDEPQRSLVTARLFDCSDRDRQQEIESLADDVATHAAFHALYVLPSAHVGFIAHMMATVQDLQPKKIKLVISFARNHVCIQRGSSRCAVSMRPLSDVFASKLGDIQGELPPGRFSHSLVVSSNDDGLFAFAARCVDAMMRSGKFSAHYQCWLPHRSSVADGNWRPERHDWAELNCDENPKSLSEVLSANASDIVIPSRNLKLKDILPRRPPIFMSHTYSGDGTGECCQRIKDALQERLLCTVWFDKAEMGWTDAFIDEMKRGMANANAFVICLSPLYLTRPNCLRELRWAMDICAVDKTKKLCVLPMHPCVSFIGCKTIVDLAAAGCAAHAILPADDRCKEVATQLNQLKAHKLSDVAVSLLQRLTGSENVGINAEWLKLQPWLSDAEGENWKETSRPWAGPCEGKSVQMSQLLHALAVDLQVAVLAACAPAPWSVFTDVEDQQLRSLPPSQDYQAPSDTALLRSTFPQLLLTFTEAEAVKLMLLGLRDIHAIDCITHGFGKNSAAAASQPNPVDAVFRMAADMSGVNFDAAAQRLRHVSVTGESNARQSTEQQQQQDAVSFSSSAATLPAPVPTSPASASAAPLDPLASQLFSINVSNNIVVLAQLSVKLQACGVTLLSDLEGMSVDDIKATVADANFNPLQFKKLLDAVSKPEP